MLGPLKRSSQFVPSINCSTIILTTHCRILSDLQICRIKFVHLRLGHLDVGSISIATLALGHLNIGGISVAALVLGNFNVGGISVAALGNLHISSISIAALAQVAAPSAQGAYDCSFSVRLFYMESKR